MDITAVQLASRFIGVVQERPGSLDDPFIVWCLSRVGLPDQHDEVPWCSAFTNVIAWMLGLQQSKLANARSWLSVGDPVHLDDAASGFDVVVLQRPPNPASGHVGFFVGHRVADQHVIVLGGNQGNAVSVVPFPVADILGIRRLKPARPV